nr:hypothetical protein [Alphaproteobacteria bacterium]
MAEDGIYKNKGKDKVTMVEVLDSVCKILPSAFCKKENKEHAFSLGYKLEGDDKISTGKKFHKMLSKHDIGLGKKVAIVRTGYNKGGGSHWQ